MASRRTSGGVEQQPVAGLGVDSFGGPVIDPSANTIAGLAGAVARLDDLRKETNRRYDRELWWTRYVAEMRAGYMKEIRELESNRLEKIRLVDVQARDTAADQQIRAIQTLAATQSAEREALRSLVATTADALAKQLTQTVGEINTRLGVLEKTSYKGEGKEAFSDPQTAALMAEVRSLRESRATGEGKSEGMSTTAKITIAGIGLVATLLGIMGTVVGLAGAAWALLQ